MSFDVSLVTPSCAACGRNDGWVFDFNITHNVNPIVEACLVAGGAGQGKDPERGYVDRSWGRLHGWRAADLVPILEIAVAEANSPARYDELRKMEPENGWGSLEGVRHQLAGLLAACRENPGCVVRARG